MALAELMPKSAQNSAHFDWSSRAASRWSIASGDRNEAKAAAITDDFETPRCTAKSSRRFACSGSMKMFRRARVIANSQCDPVVRVHGCQPRGAHQLPVEVARQERRAVIVPVVVKQDKVAGLGLLHDLGGNVQLGLTLVAAFVGEAARILADRSGRGHGNHQAAPVVLAY